MIEPKNRRREGPQLSADNRLLSLGDQLRAFAEKTGDQINRVHQILSIKLFSQIVYDTPVDTGLARGSWIPSVGAPTFGGQRQDASGGAAIREIEAVIANATYEDITFLTNNVEYIVPLEYGWSNQAPEGMVRINVARFHRMVKEAVAESKA